MRFHGSTFCSQLAKVRFDWPTSARLSGVRLTLKHWPVNQLLAAQHCSTLAVFSPAARARRALFISALQAQAGAGTQRAGRSSAAQISLCMCVKSND